MARSVLAGFCIALVLLAAVHETHGLANSNVLRRTFRHRNRAQMKTRDPASKMKELVELLRTHASTNVAQIDVALGSLVESLPVDVEDATPKKGAPPCPKDTLDLGASAAAIKASIAELKEIVKSDSAAVRQLTEVEAWLEDAKISQEECTKARAEVEKDSSSVQSSSPSGGPKSSSTVKKTKGGSLVEVDEEEIFSVTTVGVAYVLGVVYNGVVKALYQDTPLTVTQTGAVVDANKEMTVTVVEMHPALDVSTQTFTQIIDTNVNIAKTAYTAAKAANAELVILPEYGIVPDDSFNPDEHSGKIAKAAALNNYRKLKVGEGSVLHGGTEFVWARERCASYARTTKDLGYLACIPHELNGDRGGPYLAANLIMKPPQWLPSALLSWGSGVRDVLTRAINTEFIFKPNGRIHHVYQKGHPVAAEEFFVARRSPAFVNACGVDCGDIGARDQKVVIDGVTFGVMVCFDIVFSDTGYNSRDIHNWIFSTEWGSRRYLVSFLVQQAFSRATRSHVFAANNNLMTASPTDKRAYTGSGIFSGGAPLGTHFGPTPGANYQALTHRVKVGSRPASAFADQPMNGDIMAHASDHQFTELLANQGFKTAKRDRRPSLTQKVHICWSNNAKCQDNAQFVRLDTLQDGAVVEKDLVVDVGTGTASDNLSCSIKVKFGALTKDAAVKARETWVLVARVDSSSNQVNRDCAYMLVSDVDEMDGYGFDLPGSVVQEVTVTANSLGSNTALLPITGLNDPVHKIAAMPANAGGADANQYSSWTQTAATTTELFVKSHRAGAHNTDPRIVALYGTYLLQPRPRATP